AVLSPLPVQYGAFELRHVKAAVAPKAMIVAPRFKDRSLAATAAEVLGEDVELMTLGGEPGGPSVALEDLASGATGEAPRAGEADDAFTIAWTSGTTGMPKGVPRSHNHWLAIAPATYEAMQLQDGDVLLNPFPMTNMAAIGGMMSSWLHVRGQLVLHQPFDLPTFMKQLVLERVTATVAPPALLTMLLKTPKALEGVDLSHLRVIGSGSAPLSEFMVGGWRDRGIEIVNLFGSNEGVSLATGPREAESPARRAAWFPRFGHPAADFEVTMNERVETKLVAVDSGEVVEGPGTEGELLVRGPAVFEGYWGMSDEERSQVFDAEGFFRTGDLFKIAEDERFLVFSGRVKDIIIRGGHNISAAEIDGLLEGHPDLAEAAAFGVPDDVMGERIGVAVVPRPGAEVTLESVIEYLAAKDIAKNKLPEQLRILETLPRNPMNKVLRWKLVSEGPGRE
ncbi:MAG: class I adenylate-forming enzyme family protein, partial [Myxococcota bacterium]